MNSAPSVGPSMNDGDTGVTQERLEQAFRLGGHHPGTDVTASLWQVIQHTTIQHQLNATHEMYTGDNNNNNNNNDGNAYQKLCLQRGRRRSISGGGVGGGRTRGNTYNGLIQVCLKLWHQKKMDTAGQYLRLYTPIPPPRPTTTNNVIPHQKKLFFTLEHHQDYNVFRKDVEMFDTSITNLSELHRPKRWCKYMLTDDIIHYESSQKHPLYGSYPGWLVDVINICQRSNSGGLALLWCTDIWAVDEHLGSVSSLINLHHLFQCIECINKDNFTSLLLHLTVLSTTSLNPINRRGLKYPASAILCRTFEDVKRALFQTLNMQTNNNNNNNKKKKKKKKPPKKKQQKQKQTTTMLRHNNNNNINMTEDRLQSFLTRIMMVMPHKIGTNFFDLIL